ncbi:metal ABC transporter solute-binding protein, Zn/Mn family [Streptomyces griseocarneus]|uniref:metal ABC transporter solute-binding protein, Zn/Mn family n=1 Tax=Streptomyces griseocarneus TaxID=51201 RepID=UPI00167D8A38|nr:zinc ABC transporter substrate-binding protein [Streptomyces griseocarneus]MBZ6475319.1 zinc ABC transporter substrate-binding protein [Streptomyces griseocarneus]
MRAPGPVLLAVLCTAAASGCGDGAGTGPGPTGGTGGTAPASAVRVVASTNVYGDIARQVGGDKADVVSLIDDPAQDPHSYEADARNQLALSRARVVIENGGGYDDFVGKMLRTAKNPSAEVINAVQVSGKTAPAGGELNEHVWYDLTTAGRLADRVADALAKASPGDGDLFRRNARAFNDKLAPLRAAQARIKAEHRGAAVAVTEPVPLHLTEACGLRNSTPAEFSEAVEEGSEVSPSAMRQMLGLLTGKRVEALVVNEQTAGPPTQKAERTARDNGIPVVPVTETLPRGQDYISWMQNTVEALRKALDS